MSKGCQFRLCHPGGKLQVFLYDVTGGYLERTENELAAFGYNRDGKKGKRQIVIGLLCDKDVTEVHADPCRTLRP